MLLALFALLQEVPVRKLDLTVERCVELALQNNPDLAALSFAAEASEAGITEAKGTFDPIFGTAYTFSRADQAFASTFNVTGSTTTTEGNQSLDITLRQMLATGGSYDLLFRNSRSETFPNASNFLDPNVSSFLRFSVTQPLLRGAWTTYNQAGVVTAQMEKSKAERSFDEQVMATIQAVHNAYWDFVFALQDVDVKRFSLSLGERLLDINQKKVQEGVSAPVEILQAETEIAVRREALITAENSLQAAEDSLKQLVFPFREPSEWNFSIQPNSAIPSDFSQTIPGWETAIDTAFAMRPDLERSRLDVQTRELALEVAKSDLLPRLNLGASRTNTGVQQHFVDVLEDIRGSDFPGYSVSLSLEIPLGNQAAKGRWRAAEANLAVTKQNLRSLENQVAREVRDALRNLGFLREKIAATKKSLELAQRQLEAEERKFDVGLSTNFQVLEFQQDLVQALINEKAAQLDHAKAQIQLQKVQGLLRP